MRLRDMKTESDYREMLKEHRIYDDGLDDEKSKDIYYIGGYYCFLMGKPRTVADNMPKKWREAWQTGWDDAKGDKE